MKDEEDKDWFSRLNERLDNQPKPSDEEIAERREERKKIAEMLDGTSRETAFMTDDRSVTVKYWSNKDGVIADGWDDLKLGDQSYEEVCNRHGLSEPGDANTIICRWVDGKWVEETQDTSDKAKSV